MSFNSHCHCAHERGLGVLTPLATSTQNLPATPLRPYACVPLRFMGAPYDVSGCANTPLHGSCIVRCAAGYGANDSTSRSS